MEGGDGEMPNALVINGKAGDVELYGVRVLKFFNVLDRWGR